jgi:hypothetical protein
VTVSVISAILGEWFAVKLDTQTWLIWFSMTEIETYGESAGESVTFGAVVILHPQIHHVQDHRQIHD